MSEDNLINGSAEAIPAEQQAPGTNPVSAVSPPVEQLRLPPEGIRHNGPYLPKSQAHLQHLDGRQVRSVRETGYMPGHNLSRKSPTKIKYISELFHMMLEWPEDMLKHVLADTTQPIAARAAAAQMLRMLMGDDDAFDRVLDRTEGKVAGDVNNIQQNMFVNAGKNALTPEMMQKAFDAVGRKRMGGPALVNGTATNGVTTNGNGPQAPK